METIEFWNHWKSMLNPFSWTDSEGMVRNTAPYSLGLFAQYRIKVIDEQINIFYNRNKFFFSCQEVTIEPDQTGSAVFELTGKVDGEAFTFTAGEDGYFQNTNFQKNQLDQLELSGKLERLIVILPVVHHFKLF
ncbi:MAG: hypothetical protein R2784_11210 [Saprospiraceae bacterium]